MPNFIKKGNMAWYTNILKDKMIKWTIRIFTVLLALIILWWAVSTVIGTSKGQHVKAGPLEWNPNDSISSPSKSATNSSQIAENGSTITSNNGNVTNTTSGNENPIMTGQGDYKPVTKHVDNSVDTSKQYHIQGKNVAVGDNNQVGDNYYGVPPRKIQDPEVAAQVNNIISQIPNYDYPVRLYVKDDDESMRLAKEIFKILTNKGFKKIEWAYFGMLNGPRLGTITGGVEKTRRGEDIFVITIQENKH